jgi:hypothetical protein
MEKWQVASALATIAQAIVVIVTLFFIWRQVQQQTIQAQQQTLQVKQQTELARIANAQALVALSSPLNLELIKDPQIAKLWIKGAKEFESYDDVEKRRYEALLIWWLMLHENIFYQWRNGLLDDTIYSPWLYDLMHFIKGQELGKHWLGFREFYQKEFAEHVDKLIQPDTKSSA